MRYYALLQADLAVIASSRLGNNGWRIAPGHGLKLDVPAGLQPVTASLSRVTVSCDGSGVAQKLAEALESPLLAEPVPLLDLIAALPTQSLVTQTADYPRRPLAITLNSPTFGATGPSIAWDATPPRISAPTGTTQDLTFEVLEREFAFYPSLANLPKITSATSRNAGPYMRTWMEIAFEPAYTEPDGHFSDHMLFASKFSQRHIDIGRLPPSPISPQGLVLPAVGGNDRAQHPLVTWHLVLYAFSMLARYYAPFWASLVDYDENMDAVPMRLLVDADSHEAMRFVELAILGFLANEASEARAVDE